MNENICVGFSVLLHGHTSQAGASLFLVTVSPDPGNPHSYMIYTEILNIEFNYLLGWDAESTQKKDRIIVCV